MLTLGLENIKVKEEVYVSTEELLQSQLDFQNAYQAFIDYKNVCEIVVKAKASTESIEFANNLLNVSVENIEVSAEGLGDKLKTAWNKFLAMWERFFNWFKNAIKNLKPKLPVTVCPTRGGLHMLIPQIQWENKNPTHTQLNPNGVGWVEKPRADYGHVAVLNRYLKESEKLYDIEEVDTWKVRAETLIKELHKRIIYIKEHFNFNKYAVTTQSYKGTSGNEAPSKDEAIAARYYMFIGPKVIAKLQATLNKLSNTKRSKVEAEN